MVRIGAGDHPENHNALLMSADSKHMHVITNDAFVNLVMQSVVHCCSYTTLQAALLAKRLHIWLLYKLYMILQMLHACNCNS